MKTVGGVILPFSAHSLLTPYTCIKFQENISKGFRVTDQTQFVAYGNLQRGIIPLKV